MNQCRQCGATLAENSTVCLQCGAGNTPNTVELQRQRDLDFLKPALIGGSLLGLLSTVPIVQYGNCVCCMWILGGGALAAFLLDKQRPGTLTYGDGAIVGAFSGVFGAIVSTVVSIPLKYLQSAQLEQAREQLSQAEMPPALKEFLLRMMEPGLDVSFLLIGFVLGAVMFSIFATLGGILTVAILNRKKTE
jgi:hypothetical protein